MAVAAVSVVVGDGEGGGEGEARPNQNRAHRSFLSEAETRIRDWAEGVPASAECKNRRFVPGARRPR
jgi:hypothetical protein